MKDLMGKMRKLDGEDLDALKAAKSAILKKHTVAKDETLSHIALKYYGHATEAYWKLIYAFNKGVIGDDPGILKPGLELSIPVLPDALKK